MQSRARMRQLAVGKKKGLNVAHWSWPMTENLSIHRQNPGPVKGNEQILTDFSKIWISPRCTQKNVKKITLETRSSIHIPASVKNQNSLNPQSMKTTPISNVIAFIFKCMATSPENGSRGLLNVKQVTLFCLSPMFPPVYFKRELYNPRT